MSVRSFHLKDKQQVAALWRTVFPDDPAHNQPEQMIDLKLSVQDDLFFVYEQNGQTKGSVMAGFDGVRGWIHKLAAHPDLAGVGVGRQLMAAAEAGLKEVGCTKVNLQVRETNTQVIGFYKKLGYDIEPRTSMGKRLT